MYCIQGVDENDTFLNISAGILVIFKSNYVYFICVLIELITCIKIYLHMGHKFIASLFQTS